MDQVRRDPPSSWYAAVAASSSGVATAQSLCQREFIDTLTDFAKTSLGVSDGGTYLFSLDITKDGSLLYDDLPLLALHRGLEGGRRCEVKGLANSAQPIRLTPYSRSDQTGALRVTMDLKAAKDTDAKIFDSLVGYVQGISAIVGANQLVAKIGTEAVGGLSHKLDSAISASLSSDAEDQLQAELSPAGPDKVTYDLRNLVGERKAVSNSAKLEVQLQYIKSVVGTERDDTVYYTDSADTILSYDRVLQSGEVVTFDDAIRISGGFDTSLLSVTREDAQGRQRMETACRQLRSYFADELNLTPDDALVVRGAALTKADYFYHQALWNQQCLDGSYLPMGRLGPRPTGGDYDELIVLAPGVIRAPGLIAGLGTADWGDQIDELCRTLARGPTWADPRLTVNEASLLPSAFFDGMPQVSFWKAAPEEAPGKIVELTGKGCLCGRVASVQRDDVYRVRDMAIFGRTIWPAGDDYRGWRVGPDGPPIVPLLTEWTNDDPPKLTDVVVAPVPTIQQDHGLSDADWPSGGNCEGIEGPR
jgi:hypothetical protein